jgi:hypothetical protein
MKKIASLFKRDYENTRLVYDEIVPGAEWVVAGEGVATVKWDGTACMVRDGRMFKRYDRKAGKPAPNGWEPCQDAPDENTGHWPGWVPVGDGAEDKWHREAFESDEHVADGTYELVGPKVQGNPYYMGCHILVRHGARKLVGVPVTFDGLRQWLSEHDVEGIVWHHSDGRMVKIKRRDFGLSWPTKQGDK